MSRSKHERNVLIISLGEAARNELKLYAHNVDFMGEINVIQQSAVTWMKSRAEFLLSRNCVRES